MSFWSEIKSTALSFVASIEHASLAFFTGAAVAIEQSGGELLVELAQDAVVAAENTGGTGTQKLAAAQHAVIGSLASQGIPIALNAINIAIEAAVANLRTHGPAIAEANPAAPPVKDLGSVADPVTEVIDQGELGAGAGVTTTANLTRPA